MRYVDFSALGLPELRVEGLDAEAGGQLLAERVHKRRRSVGGFERVGKMNDTLRTTSKGPAASWGSLTHHPSVPPRDHVAESPRVPTRIRHRC